MTTRQPITQVCFSYALDGGLTVRRGSDSGEFLSTFELIAEVGEIEACRLMKIAHAGGWCGMWYNATNGRNVYRDGVCVNP